MPAPKLFSTLFLIAFLSSSWAATSVPSSLLSLVPHIQTKGVTVHSWDDHYGVRIILPSLAFRLETVREIAPGNLHVKGFYKQQYVDRPKSKFLVLQVDYEADANGFRAKYSLTREDNYVVVLSSPVVLKTLAG